ncbi:MAG: T9SS type A sorting domain-containing protein [Salibacteraceae bacterium]
MSFQRILLLVFLVTIIGQSSYAQKSKEYAPISAVWGYSYVDFSCFPSNCRGGWVDEVLSDTIILGSRFAEIQRTEYARWNIQSIDTIYRGIVNDSLIEIVDNKEEFILDFSWKENDTVLLIGESYSKADSLRVTFSLSDSIFNGLDTIKIVKPKLFPVQNPSYGWVFGAILRGVGSLSHKLSYADGARDGITSPLLKCYEEPTGFEITDSPSKSCKQNMEEWIALTIKNIELFNSYFIQTKDAKLILSNKQIDEPEGGDLVIRNLQGQTVLLKKNYVIKSEVDISTFSKGLYFLEYTLSNKPKVSLKFIISE